MTSPAATIAPADGGSPMTPRRASSPARRQLVDDHIRALVDAAPELTAEQAARIRVLLPAAADTTAQEERSS